MQEGEFAILFRLCHGKICSHLAIKVIESKFTDEITKSWACHTPYTPLPAMLTVNIVTRGATVTTWWATDSLSQ